MPLRTWLGSAPGRIATPTSPPAKVATRKIVRSRGNPSMCSLQSKGEQHLNGITISWGGCDFPKQYYCARTLSRKRHSERVPKGENRGQRVRRLHRRRQLAGPIGPQPALELF